MTKETIKILLIEETSKDVNLKELISAKKDLIDIHLIKTTSILEAKKIISEQNIDVILSYIDLSDIKNLETIDLIKNQSPQLPVIVITDVEDLSLQRKIIQKNVQDCLSINHLDSYNLLRSINHAIERKKNENIHLKEKFEVDNLSTPFYLVNSDATIQYVNKETCKYLGYSKEELLSMTIFDFDVSFNNECWAKHWKKLKEKGSETVETIHKTKDGNLINIEINANYFELDGHEFNFAYGFNITEKKKLTEFLYNTMEELKESKKELIISKEIHLKPDILSTLSSKEEMSHINLLNLVNLEDLQKIQDSFAIANDVASLIIDLEGNAITKPSNFCDVCKLVRQTEKGQLNCAQSDRLIGEKALEKMGPHYESCHSCGFVDASAPIIVEDKIVAHWLIGQSNVGGVNNDRISAYAEEIGADKDEMLKAYGKMTNMSLDRFEKITELLWLFAQEISNKGYNNLKLAQELKRVRQTELSLKQSIDDLKASEKKLEDKQKELIESQALLNSILENAPAGILVGKAPDMKLCISNKAANEITGQTIQDWSKIDSNNIPLQFKIFYPDGTPYKDDELPFVRSFRNLEIIQNEEQFIRLADGTEKSVLISTTPVFDDNDNLTAAMAIFTDITERKKLEKELLSQNAKLLDKQNQLIESQALLNSILDQAPVGVLACKAPDMALYITNKAANEITGLQTERWKMITLNNIDLHYENFYPDRTPYKLENLPLPRAFRDEEIIVNEEIILQLSDGKEKWITVNAAPVYDSNHNIIAATAIVSDITEHKKLENELIDHKNNLEKTVKERTDELNKSLENIKTINLHLERANKHKNQFISSMSHELRTPLNAIIGFTQTLEKKYFGELNEKQMEYIQLVKESGEHLLSLINDILNIAKIDSGTIEFLPENIKVEKCIREIVSIMSAQFKDKKINLGYSIGDDIDIFYSDERKCKQILFNLLSNALKFTREGGKVNIEASKKGDFINIAVIDDGIGIKEKDIERVFEEFYQSDTTRDQALGGAGIGLALTERLVKLHGGTIGVESKLNRGSKFSFTIPVNGK